MMSPFLIATFVAGDPEWNLPALMIGVAGVLLAVWIGRSRQAALKIASAW